VRFLFRMVFWLGIVLVLLPSAGSDQTTNTTQVSAGDAVSLATAAASDMRQFCERKPEACEIGSQVALALGYRAQAGAKMLYDFLTEQLAPSETGSIPATHDKPSPTPDAKGPVNAKVAAQGLARLQAIPGSQDTLTAADLEPEWRGPAPRRDRHSQPRA